MSKRALHRLNAVYVPGDPDRGLDEEAWVALRTQLIEEGILESGGGPLWSGGAAAGRLVEGGFARLRLDRPGGRAVYGNRQGGYRVWCPACRSPLARPFSRAAELWKGGGSDRLECSACGAEHGLAELGYAPPVALGRFGLELLDAGSLLPGPGVSLLESLMGPEPRIIGWRG